MVDLNQKQMRYPSLPDDKTAVLAVLGTIRQHIADAFVQLETLQAGATDTSEPLDTLQEDLADIQVNQLPTLESMFGVMFVNIDPEGSVIYDQIEEE